MWSPNPKWRYSLYSAYGRIYICDGTFEGCMLALKCLSTPIGLETYFIDRLSMCLINVDNCDEEFDGLTEKERDEFTTALKEYDLWVKGQKAR